jgi:hypothetical protein
MTKNISKIINENDSLDLILGTKLNEPINSTILYNPNEIISPNEIIILS